MHLKIKGGSTGATTKVYVDGKLLGRCCALSYDIRAGGLATVTLVMWPAKVEIDTKVDDAQITRITRVLPGRRPQRK